MRAGRLPVKKACALPDVIGKDGACAYLAPVHKSISDSQEPPRGLIGRLFRWLETRINIFAPFPDGETPPTNVWRFMWWHIREVKGWLAAILLTGLAFSGIEALLYLMVGWFVDLLTYATPDAVWRDHGWTLLGVAFLIVVVRPIVYFMNHAVVDQVVTPAITNRVRWRSHVYTLGHALNYFNNDFAGRVGSRVIEVGRAIRGATIEIVDDLWYVLVFSSVAIGFFSQTSLWLALPVALWLAAYIGLLWFYIPRAVARSEVSSQARSLVTARVMDSYTNIMTVKLFARGEAERTAVATALRQWNNTFFDLNRLITGATAFLQFINSVLIVIAAALCLYFWRAGDMTPGAVAASVGIVLRLVQMSGWVMHLVRGIFENIGAVQEAMQTIAKPHAVVDVPNAKPLAMREGEIRFEHVKFHYGKDSGVFDDLSLTIRPGEKVGLVGPSGAGKSTLVNLMLRLYDVEGGRILIDGQDIAKVTQDSLRGQIGMVTQDTSLLHRSIRDNIAYGRPDATDADIARAAAMAKADQFIAGLEDQAGRKGYESRVGERGVKLSGGQRQRIAIARVILKDAPILVMDEATAALDSEVEAAIQDGLKALMDGKTAIVIAHRLSTIAALDRLIVLDKGRIVEEGSHAALLARDGLYARLWRRQTGGFLALDDDKAAA